MARRSRRKARYSVDMSVKAWDLAKAGSAIEIAIRDRDDLLGTIRIGQGGFHWHPAHGKEEDSSDPVEQVGRGFE